MHRLLLTLRKFSADAIEKEKWGADVAIAVFDQDMNPMCEMTARKNEDGTWLFGEERILPGTVYRPGPYTVKFTVAGKTFTRDFPHHLD
jgi:hypothetical protein